MSDKPRSTADLQAEISDARERLVTNLDKLKAETKPKVLVAKAKARAKASLVDPDTGLLRTERLVAVGVGVVGLYLVRRGMKARAGRRELERLREVVWVPVPRRAVSPEIAKVAREAAELAPGPMVETITTEALEAGHVPLAIGA